MAVDEVLAGRVRTILRRRRGVEEKRMFGGLAFLVDGRMCVGVLADDLMARLGPDRYEGALREEGCRAMDFTGRPMRGFVFVGPKGTESEADLRAWIGLALEFNRSARAPRRRK